MGKIQMYLRFDLVRKYYAGSEESIIRRVNPTAASMDLHEPLLLPKLSSFTTSEANLRAERSS